MSRWVERELRYLDRATVIKQLATKTSKGTTTRTISIRLPMDGLVSNAFIFSNILILSSTITREFSIRLPADRVINKVITIIISIQLLVDGLINKTSLINNSKTPSSTTTREIISNVQQLDI